MKKRWPIVAVIAALAAVLGGAFHFWQQRNEQLQSRSFFDVTQEELCDAIKYVRSARQDSFKKLRTKLAGEFETWDVNFTMPGARFCFVSMTSAFPSYYSCLGNSRKLTAQQVVEELGGVDKELWRGRAAQLEKKLSFCFPLKSMTKSQLDDRLVLAIDQRADTDFTKSPLWMEFSSSERITIPFTD